MSVPRDDGGRKDDAEKSRIDLLDPEFIMSLGRLAGYGAKKYAEDGWRLLKVMRMFAALMRHALLFAMGEDVDAETGEPHMTAVAFNAMAIRWIVENRPDQDDRWREPKHGRDDRSG